MAYMDNPEATGQLLFFGGLSSPPSSRWIAFVLSWGIQVQIILLLIIMQTLFPEGVKQTHKYEVINLVTLSDAEVMGQTSVNLSRKVNALPQPRANPRHEAKLLVSPSAIKALQPQAEVSPPELHVAAIISLPEIPKAAPAPEQIVVTNTFSMPSHPTFRPQIAASETQMAGFSEPASITSEHGMRQVIANVSNPGFTSGGLRADNSAAGLVGGGTVRVSGFDKEDSTLQRRTELRNSATGNVPEILSKPKPHYTEEALKGKVEGEVSLEVLFRADGRAQVLRILQGLGHGLDEQAAQAAEQIKFKPAEHDGRAVDSTFVVHIVFELTS